MSKKQSKKKEKEISLHEEAAVSENTIETEVVDIDVESEGIHEHIHVETAIEEEIEIHEAEDEIVTITLDEMPNQSHLTSSAKDNQVTDFKLPQAGSLSVTEEINAVIKLLEHERDYENAAQLHVLLTKLGEVKVYLNFIESNIPHKAKHLIDRILSNL